MTLGQVIRGYRKKNNISLGEFARKAGLSKSYLFALEKNLNPSTGKKINPTFEVALACCKAMEMDIVTFVKKVAPDIAEDIAPYIQVQSVDDKKKMSSSLDSLPTPSTLYMPTDVPKYMPIDNTTINEAYKERRILILETAIPRKGELVYIPIKEYMMPVAFTVLQAGGGMFLANAEACGTCLFSIFDLGRTVFTNYGGARKIVSKWEYEANPF